MAFGTFAVRLTMPSAMMMMMMMILGNYCGVTGEKTASSFPPLFVWDKTLGTPPTFRQADVTNGSDEARKFLSTVLSTGLAKATPKTPTTMTQKNDANTCVSFGWNFGETTTMAAQSSSSSSSLSFYTLWQANEATSLKALDGFHASRVLCEQNPSSFHALTEANVLHVDDDDKDSATAASCPAIRGIDWDALQVRVNNPTSSPEVEDAKMAFWKLVGKNLNEWTVRLTLKPNDALLWDSARLYMHFEPGSDTNVNGSKKIVVQGCHVHRASMQDTYKSLDQKYQALTETPFRNLRDATKSDFDRMGVEYDKAVSRKTLDKMVALLEGLRDSFLGAPVSLYEHNVQTASRAFRAGEDDDTVTAALFHDVFETLGVKNHGELSAALLAPWLTPKNTWMLAHHEIFQSYYYFDYYDGLDKNRRDMFLPTNATRNDHEAQMADFYNWTVYFCEEYDQASFDKDYPSLPLEALLPSVERVLKRKQYWWNPSHPKAGAVSAKEEEEEGAAGKVQVDASGDLTAVMNAAVTSCVDTWNCY